MAPAALMATLALLAISIVWHIFECYRSRTVAVRRRVVVNLVDDRAITGVLWRRHRTLIVLRGTQLIEPGREPVVVDGEMVIERDRIAFIQIVGG